MLKIVHKDNRRQEIRNEISDPFSSYCSDIPLKHNPKLREYKDMPDIIELIKVNKVDVKSAEFKELCLKYGSAIPIYT